MAVSRRGKPLALLHHSDQRSQYTRGHFQQLRKANEIMKPASTFLAQAELDRRLK